MTNISISNVTYESLLFAVRVGDVVRWQVTLKRDDEASFIIVAGKKYKYADVRDIWEKCASQHDLDGNLSLPFAFHVEEPPIDHP